MRGREAALWLAFVVSLLLAAIPAPTPSDSGVDAAQRKVAQREVAPREVAPREVPPREVPPREVPPVRTVISLTFDDGYASQVAAARVLDRHALAGTFYVNSGTLGWEGYLTLPQLREIAAAGHEIGGHALSHDDLTTMSPRRLKQEICGDRAALARLGYTTTSFAYPYGAANGQVARQVRLCGYNSARGVGGLYGGPGDCTDCPAAEELSPGRGIWTIRTATTVRAWPETVRRLRNQVRRAETEGGWLPLVFHRICDRCSEQSTTEADLAAFAAWLARRPPTTAVRTVDQVAGGPERPVVGPTPAQVGGLPPFAEPQTARAAAAGSSVPGSGRSLNDAVAFTVIGFGVGQFQVIAVTVTVALILIGWFRFRTRHLRPYRGPVR